MYRVGKLSFVASYRPSNKGLRDLVIVEQGTHDSLLDAEGAYWRLYRDWMEQAAA